MSDEIEYNTSPNSNQLRNVAQGVNTNQTDGSVTFSQEQIIKLQATARLVRDIKNGMGWFTAVAGLTAINSFVTVFKGDFYFVIGLGITQLLDGLASLLAEDLSANSGAIVKFVALAISLLIAGVFFLFGYFGKKGKKWVVTLGIILYALDALLLLLWTDIVGIVFHGLALFYMIKGLRALNKLTHQTKPHTTNVIPLHQG
jgi:hypothetical protein